MRRLGIPAVATALLFLLVTLLVGCSAWKRFAYEGFDRDSWQQPDRVITELGVKAGDVVADLGAGGGYFTFRLADAVGPTGRVYAVDVDEDMIEYLQERAADEGYENVEVIRGEFSDPLLPDGQVDLIFTCNTYHHIEERPAYFGRVRKDLAPGGRVAILDLNGTSWFARTAGHFTPKEEILGEMGEAGYRTDEDFDFVDRQTFAVFAPGR